MTSITSCEGDCSDWTEAERLDALRETGILDTERDPAYDDVVRIAAVVCAAPVVLVSLVDETRQWFKARIGFEPSETPRSMSICAHAVASGALLVIPDLTADPRTACNPLVTGEHRLRFYAGAVIRAKAGQPLGSLCVLDRVTRPDGLTQAQRETLETLARQVGTLIDLKVAREAVVVREAELAASERRFRVMTGAMPQMV